MKLILRVIINAIAIWLTALLLPSISLTNNIFGILGVAIIFGLVNALIRPLVKLLSLPLTVMTLGLFTLVINTAMLMLTALFAGDWLKIEGNFLEMLLYAFLASILISIISTILSWFLPDKKD
jgi:putative membrane protein